MSRFVLEVGSLRSKKIVFPRGDHVKDDGRLMAEVFGAGECDLFGSSRARMRGRLLMVDGLLSCGTAMGAMRRPRGDWRVTGKPSGI